MYWGNTSVAEMEGRTADRDRFKGEADTAKVEFTRLAEIALKKREEEEARKKAELEGNTNTAKAPK